MFALALFPLQRKQGFFANAWRLSHNCRTVKQKFHFFQRGVATFIEVGEALLEIRDSRLYRIEFSTFEDYCREKWQFTKTQANRLVQSAVITANLTPMGVIPSAERQARPLTKLKSPEQQREAWQKAVEASPTSGGV